VNDMNDEEKRQAERVKAAYYKKMEGMEQIQSPAQMVGTAIELLFFALHLDTGIQTGKITAENLPKPLKVLFEDEGILMRDKEYDPKAMQANASNLTLATIAISAIATDAALESLGPRDPNDTSELGSARNIIYMIRNAFAHNPFSPKWVCDSRYQKTYCVGSIKVELDGSKCNGQSLQPKDFGWYRGYLDLLKFCFNKLSESSQADKSGSKQG
jgi:hypothetical protein